MNQLTLAEAKSLYASTGFCEHKFTKPIVPYGCEGVSIITCMVCAEEMERVYC